MAGFSIWHWIILLIVGFFAVWPLWRIIKRTGNPPALALLFFVPFANLALIWFLALGRWPAVDGKS